MMLAADELSTTVGTLPACRALGVHRSGLYRRRRPRPATVRLPRRRPPSALDLQERQAVLDVLHSERFVDKAPREVFATLLDEGSYVCSIRTIYRILDEEGEVRERRDQLRHPSYKKPELLATAPNDLQNLRLWQ